MAQQNPSGVVRQASTWSILWGVSLIVLGALAVGVPLLAAVAVNVVIAWLILLAGVAHLMAAFHARAAGSVVWRLLVGIAYLLFGVYLIARPAVGVASLTLLLASLFLVEGILEIVLFFPHPLSPRIKLDSVRWDHYAATRGINLRAVAVKLSVGDRDISGGRLARQRRSNSDGVVGSPEGSKHDIFVRAERLAETEG